MEYEQVDLAWDILKLFSLLTVKDGKGTIHRLLLHSMRASQSADTARNSLSICIETVSSIWGFEADKPETWNESVRILEHVMHVVAGASRRQEILTHQQLLLAADLSIQAALVSAMTLNAFEEAKTSLELALALLGDKDRFPYRLKGPCMMLKACTWYELGKVHRYRGEFSKSETSLDHALELFSCLEKEKHILECLACDRLRDAFRSEKIQVADTFYRKYWRRGSRLC
jgi:hypothetical protein